MPPATRLGRYEIRSKIGEGGMGEVYLAEDTTLRRLVAIKFLPSDSTTNEHAKKRLLREAQAAAKLDHPNICAVHEVAEADGRNFIVMPFVEGETLATRMKHKPLDVSESLAIGAQVADALAEAHAHGIIHRDIKPSNIIITPRGQAKVMDFGLARFSEPSAMEDALNINAEASTQALLTKPGMIIGTVPYMSPEQVKAEKVDARTDIFSFGVVLYEMLTGHQPFAAASGAATISAILTTDPEPVGRCVDECSEELQRIVHKCLEKDTDRRYQTIRDVATDLDNCRRECEVGPIVRSKREPTAATAPTTSTTPAQEARRFFHWRRTLIATACLIALAGVALGYVLVSRWRATSSSPPEIKSLAVLPLKSLDAGDNYLGLGIADAVIRRISQTGVLIVRPTSAVRRYLNEDTDPLSAARQLSTDAVMEGSVQRADQRLRVSVNLLRVSDGASLWTNNFDLQMTDIFTIQDTVAQQVASHLRLQLDPSQQARLTRRSTSNPVAYEFYLKGVYNFDQRISQSESQVEVTIDFFRKAIEADPNFALAHAKLGYAYALKATFIEPTEPVWVERAKEEINQAQELDPQLAETHLARFQMLFSQHESYQGEAAVRELQLAQGLNPNIGHAELGGLYIHLGLEDLAKRELERALEIDPTSEFAKGQILNLYEQGARYDEWLAAHQKFFPNDPNRLGEAWYFNRLGEAWYLMGKGRLEEAQKAIDEMQKAIAERGAKMYDILLRPKKSLLFALKGDFRAAEAEIPVILAQHPAKDPFYHHATYDIARIYALEGKSDEAVKWLRETSASGFQPYPMFGRDAYLNRIRKSTSFIQFMTEMKAQNEKFRSEFADNAAR